MPICCSARGTQFGMVSVFVNEIIKLTKCTIIKLNWLDNYGFMKIAFFQAIFSSKNKGYLYKILLGQKKKGRKKPLSRLRVSCFI